MLQSYQPSNFENDLIPVSLEFGPKSVQVQSLMASNFAALWPTDPKFLALKDLNPFKTVSKVQKISSILRVGFFLSKWPHLHRVYLLGVRYWFSETVYEVILLVTISFIVFKIYIKTDSLMMFSIISIFSRALELFNSSFITGLHPCFLEIQKRILRLSLFLKMAC